MLLSSARLYSYMNTDAMTLPDCVLKVRNQWLRDTHLPSPPQQPACVNLLYTEKLKEAQECCLYSVDLHLYTAVVETYLSDFYMVT